MKKKLIEKQQIEKIRDIIEDSKVGMMSTNLGQMPYNVFPMGTQKVDDEGNLWFYSLRNSVHFKDIQKNSKVQITYSIESKNDYLSIIGDAVPIMDKNKIEELWNPMLDIWFEGKNDPNLVLLKIRIEQAKYWDLTSNKMTSLRSFPKSQLHTKEARKIVSH